MSDKKDEKQKSQNSKTVKKVGTAVKETVSIPKKIIGFIKQIKAIISVLTNALTWKILLLVLVSISIGILVYSLLDLVFEFQEAEVNGKAAVIDTYFRGTKIDTQQGSTVTTTVTSPVYKSDGSGGSKQVLLEQNDDYTGYEFSYDNSPQNLEQIKEQLHEKEIYTEEFSDFEIVVLGALINNGANLDYYTDEDLKCFASFFKAEAATQNLDLRPNSEKIINGKYVPQSREDLSDNEVPGTILVQRTNTNGSTPVILEYKEKGVFEEALAQDNPSGDILNYFTINENGNIVIAKWENVKVTIDGEYPEGLDESEKEIATSEEGRYILDTEEIQYYEYISKYKMPFEFLIQLLVVTQQPNFCMDLVDYALDSKIIIDIQEQQTVTVTDETRNYVIHSKDKKYLNYKISAVQQQIVKEENIGIEQNYLNYGQKDDEGNSCTNYYMPPENRTIKIHTEYTSNVYSFEVIEADTWMVRYTKKYDYSNAQGITEPSTSTNMSSKGQYKKVEKENANPITDQTVISEDKDVKTFISTTKANYEPRIVVPTKIVIGDIEYYPEGTSYVPLYVVFGNGVKEEYKKCQETYVGSGKYDFPEKISIITEKVASTEKTKEIPEINYQFELKTNTDENTGESTYSYELKTNINPLVDCNVYALSIDEYQKIDLLDTSTRTTTITKYPTDETPIVDTYIYAINNQTGQFEKFLAAYDKSKGAKNNLSSTELWLYERMEMREETVELIDIVKYLLYIYDGQDRGVTSIEGITDLFKPREMKNANNTDSYNQFLRYLHSYEGGGVLPTYKNSNGEECYKVESDGSANGLAVGYGVDIATHGTKLTSLGYDISKGALIPVEVVDRIEKEELSNWVDYVKTETAELQLTEYQIYALVSRSYNCGYASTTNDYSSTGLDFVASFKKYWKQETDDKYGQDPSATNFNHELYTTFMSKPVTSNGEYLKGLENRRKSEWCLFQTGYYGYDIKYGAGNGLDEYCSAGTSDFTNYINLYNADGSVNTDSIDQLEDWITKDLLNTKVHKGDYAMQNGPFEKWWDSKNNEFTIGNKFQCTWYVYGRANQYLELYGTTHKKWPGTKGNAGTWYYRSDNGGEKYFECGEEPRQNSIVVWKNGSYGHVAFVEAVDTVNNKVYISHAGSGRSWLGITEHTIDEMKTLWGYQLLGYIYLDSPK